MSTPLDIQAAAQTAHQEDEGRTITLQQADGTPYDPPATITVAGSYSRVFREAKIRLNTKLVRQRRAKPTGEQVEHQQLELVAACVLGWEGIVANGQPVPCTPVNALALLEAAPWVREQVEEVMYDHEGFSRSSSATS